MLAFYADESGSFSVRDPGQPWVVLLAIGFDDDHWTTIELAMNDLKRAYFPRHKPQDVEIGSNDLRMAHVRPDPQIPFSALSPAALRGFGRDLYMVMDGFPFSWCAAVVHKPTEMRRFPKPRADDLFALAYVKLLRKLDRWCCSAGKTGRLFMDQRESDLHGRVHDAIIRAHDLMRDDEEHQSPLRVVERPYFHDSARSNHIQLADVVAYNVLRRIRDRNPNYPYFKRIRPKMHWATNAKNDETG